MNSGQALGALFFCTRTHSFSFTGFLGGLDDIKYKEMLCKLKCSQPGNSVSGEIGADIGKDLGLMPGTEYRTSL